MKIGVSQSQHKSKNGTSIMNDDDRGPVCANTRPDETTILSDAKRDYRREKLRRRRALQRRTKQRITQSEELLQFARIWAPYGGAPDEEVFIKFGITGQQFREQIAQQSVLSNY